MFNVTSIWHEILPILQQHASETGYSLKTLSRGFQMMLSHWNPAEADDFVKAEIPCGISCSTADFFNLSMTSGERSSAVAAPHVKSLLLVTASTVPSASFQDIMLSLLLPIQVTQRPAHNLMPLFVDLRNAVNKFAPDFASRWNIMEPSHDDGVLKNTLAKHDAVSVSGSDETIALYKSLIDSLPPENRPKLIAHGHRLSAAIIRAGEFPDEENLKPLAFDASIWDQTGCLSPKCLFIESENPKSAMAIAQKLAEQLDAVAEELPEIPPDPVDSAARNSALLMAGFDGAEIIRAKRNHDVIAVWPENAGFEPLFFPRTLNVYAVSDAIKAAEKIAPFGQALGSISPLSPEETERLRQAGYNYFCRFGNMQNPPITWFHDGIGTLAPLFKHKP